MEAAAFSYHLGYMNRSPMPRPSTLHPSSGARRGFTLTELLVVIAIIGLLAAILFPVFGRIRENSRRSSCASNMKQLGSGFQMYMRDFDEKFPLSGQGSDPVEGSWVPGGGGAAYPFPAPVSKGALYPYVKNVQVYVCPSDTNAKTKALSYTMSLLCSGKRVASAYRTSQTAMLVDESATLNDGNFSPKLCGGGDDPTLIHNNGSNFLYVDSHVKWMTPGQPTKDTYRFSVPDPGCP